MSAPEKIYVRVNYGNVTARWAMSRQERSDVLYIRADIHEAEISATQTALSLMHKTAEVMHKEIDALKDDLLDTRRMLLWLRNHYDIEMNHAPMHKKMKAQVLARVDRLIPSDGSAPDYSDIPYKWIHL